MRAEAKRRAEEAKKARAEHEKLAEDLRGVEAMTSYREAYNLGVATSKHSRRNYPLAEAAFKKAWELGPKKRFREQVSSRSTIDLKLVDVPTRLARVYRGTGQLDQAQKTYE